jgi:hypothetical protein
MTLTRPTMRIGVRISVYDDHDNELAKEAVWIPDVREITEWRPVYDQICAALWDIVGELVRNARSAHAHNHGEPV